MLKNPASKYAAFPAINLPDRQWPGKTIKHAPIWMSTDLRDGNQALFEPMSIETKLAFFEMLTRVGLKEIEVAFPAASQTEFDFVRRLIEEKRIPDDVTIEVLTQAREHLIERTFEALRGARRAIVHIYNATAPEFRRTVFGVDRAGCIRLAVDAATRVREQAARYPETEWVFQYSPEVFSATELDFALEITEAVADVWQPTPARPMILNLPATVEGATPNVYADQIEWMSRHLTRRNATLISVHPHNDRGTAVAAAELALMAGADRVEGCLFGNGERTGNVDLVTVALNLYTQGVDPGLDFSNINEVARVVEEATRLPIHPRHPYVGDLVFTAFSGSHQDAIKKGFAVQQADAQWAVPYMPIDPHDLGRSYESVIRVNSQSGKGGIAWLMENAYGLSMPRRMQVEFSGVVQQHMDDTGAEMTASDLWQLFESAYLTAESPLRLIDHRLDESRERHGITLEVEAGGMPRTLAGTGNGPLAAALAALGVQAAIHSFEEHSLGTGSDARAVAFVEITVPGRPGTVFGAGCSTSIMEASLRALVSALNRSGVTAG
ncbi:2-isopropylmalate synthase [Uliginosibacterium sp. 31-16]|uniref:2-isopropylmalate synthase n=1 Tax=Uliginosibacterium sp. 31-16 TaxID=3068315 RepID=UPI00273F2F51|nr:2-isopropylmalate synthase [Uliginosibacterium sp. 31-16]MDP5239869.1 2-isopropylmalate synthase [Uliginosibacterium sp. 31-16]